MKFSETCCATSKQQLEWSCVQHPDNCPDQLLKYIPENKWDYHDYIPAWFALVARNATYSATYCPFCGSILKDTCIPEL